MARFNVNDAENYGGQGGGGFFSLKKDKEVAKIRLLYNGIEDVQGDSVHEVDLNGKKRYVNCLRAYGDPIDKCPLCAAGKFVQVKYFVPIYNIDTGSVQTWERGKKFGAKLTSICSRFPNTVTHIFEVERNGQPNDTSTTYEIYETGDTPEVSLEDFEIPNVIGGIVLDKTADEMQTYLDTGSFGEDGGNGGKNSYAPRRQDNAQQSGGGYIRRTPASGNGRREAF
jgi:hypothetical protein